MAGRGGSGLGMGVVADGGAIALVEWEGGSESTLVSLLDGLGRGTICKDR